MSFIIEINGKDITTLEEIRENFDIDVLLSHRDNFDVWLAGWDYEDEAAQVRDLPPHLSDDDWLKKICKIIGVPSATLTAAKRKRTSDAKKAEKAATDQEDKKQRTTKNTSDKRQREKLLDRLKINFSGVRKLSSPELVSENGMFVGEVFSSDGVNFIKSNIDCSSLHSKIKYLNGFFVAVEGYEYNFCYSADGVNWTQIDKDALRMYQLSDVVEDVNIVDFVYNGSEYVVLCSQRYTYEKGGWFSDSKSKYLYYIAKAKSLDGVWKLDKTTLEEAGFLEFHEEKYFAYDVFFGISIKGVQVSDDAVSWRIACEPDRKWLEWLRISDKYGISWDNTEKKFRFYSLSSSPKISNNIVFDCEGDTILAAPVIDAKQQKFGDFKEIAKCGIGVKEFYLLKDKILLWGDNDTYVIGEIIFH